MKFVHIFIIASILLSFNFLKADEVRTENKIAKNLRCLICQGQSVYDSDSEFATSLKLVIKNKIQQGMSEEQIYSFLKTKYGDPGNDYSFQMDLVSQSTRLGKTYFTCLDVVRDLKRKKRESQDDW